MSNIQKKAEVALKIIINCKAIVIIFRTTHVKNYEIN